MCCMSFILIWFEVFMGDIFLLGLTHVLIVHHNNTSLFVLVVKPSFLFLFSRRGNGDKLGSELIVIVQKHEINYGDQYPIHVIAPIS
jgi:hypothetical protein